jgi:predicted permease
VAQIAICAVLVTSSIVAVRGLVRSLHSNFGFEPRNAMLVNTDLTMAGYSADRVPAVQKRMIEAVQTIPGVTSVALINEPPLLQAVASAPVYRDETTDLRPSNSADRAMTFEVSPDYFAAAGTALLFGRSITWHDDRSAQAVAVVNRQFASKMFGSAGSALGKYFKRANGTRIQVVGVVENGKYASLTEDAKPAMFLSILQSPAVESWMVVRSSRDPQQVAGAVRSAVRDVDAELPVFIDTWTKQLDGALFPARVATVALGVMGTMGALLAVTGIFGMAAYSVSKRLREFGIRIALGAQHREVLQAALGRAVKLLAFGSAAGLALGVLASQVLASIVYQASPRDPLVLGGVVLVMALLGLLATWIPARRVLSVDPWKLLREE